MRGQQTGAGRLSRHHGTPRSVHCGGAARLLHLGARIRGVAEASVSAEAGLGLLEVPTADLPIVSASLDIALVFMTLS